MSIRPCSLGLALAALLAACTPDPPGPPTSGDPRAGRAALREYGCGVCHRIPGVRGAGGLVGPPLEAFGKRVYIAGRFANNEVMLVRWIMNPPALEPSTAMPVVGVEEADARDMAAYLLSLR